jgi:hypothetical protein
MIVITGQVWSMSKEDGGAALIADVDSETESSTDGSFFVRLQSWNETTRKHETLESLRGKKVRITVEVL